MAHRKYSDLQLACAVAESKNMREVCRKLGLAAQGATYVNIRRNTARLGLDISHFPRKGPPLPKFGDDQLRLAVAQSRSIAQVLRTLGIEVRLGYYKTVWKRIAKPDLNTSHFLGQAWRRGTRGAGLPSGRPPRPLQRILIEGHFENTARLRERLIKEGLKEHVCESCGLTTWKGRPVPLELDHVNGKRLDNRLVNLRLVCPNCHAQTPTYRGKNIRSSSYS